LEGQLEVVGLELMAKGIMAGTHSKTGGREFQILGAATLKLREPNEVLLPGMLVLKITLVDDCMFIQSY